MFQRGARPRDEFGPYRIYSIDSWQPVQLLHYIQVLGETRGKKAQLEFLPLQPNDVLDTWAGVSDLARDFGYQTRTSIDTGMKRFVDRYRSYFASNRRRQGTNAPLIDKFPRYPTMSRP